MLEQTKNAREGDSAEALPLRSPYPTRLKELTRRIPLIIACGGLVVSLACGSEPKVVSQDNGAGLFSSSNISTPSTPSRTTVPASLPTSETKSSSSNLLPVHINPERFYRGVNRYPLKASDRLSTSLSAGEIFNYTDYKIDFGIVNQYYAYFEKFGLEGGEFDYDTDDGRTLPVEYHAASNYRKYLYFITESMPYPDKTTDKNGKVINITAPAYTHTDKASNTMVSYVRVRPNIPAVNRFLAVEAFQSSVTVKSINEDESHNLQEVLANSMGIAFTFKQYDRARQEFIDQYQGEHLGLPGFENYPILVAPTDVYNSIPKIGPAIR
jgi:hypothetical protein